MPVIRNTFVMLISVLLGIGVLMVYSASITARPTEFEQVYLSRHLIFLGLAVTAGVSAALLPAEFWRRASPWLFGGTVALLAIVLLPGVGHRVNGAQRWLRYGVLSLQPSELAKITLPLHLCFWSWHCNLPDSNGATRSLRSRRNRDVLAEWHKLAVLLPVAVAMLLVAAEPDLGTAVFLGVTAAVALFAGGWPLRCFLVAGAAAIPLVGGLMDMKPYQWQRITGYLAAWSDFDLAPYQVRQSLLTLGVGGVNGVGLGRGWQKLSFLPEANTDFVFGVVGEELGLIGTLGLVGLWVGVYGSGLRLLDRLDRRSFGYVAGFSLLTQLVLQAALNVAVVTAMVPPKGIALPLVSYGGTSLVVSVLALGMVVSLSRGERPAGAESVTTVDRSSRTALVA